MSTEQEQYDTWLLDMDGVLMHEEIALPGAEEFVDCLWEQERQFLVLTNNSIYTRRDLAARLAEAESGLKRNIVSPKVTRSSVIGAPRRV